MISNANPGCRAVFLDRDGTINVEKDYLHRVEDFEFIPGVPAAILRLNQAGFKVFVVTNQSGVARGFFNQSQVEQLHAHMDLLLAEVGAKIDGYYICPHHPEAGEGAYRQECRCRKPHPGMLLQAADEHHVDLAGSFMVGDKLADMEAGLASGCCSILVQTGYGKQTLKALSGEAIHSFSALPCAVDFILSQASQTKFSN